MFDHRTIGSCSLCGGKVTVPGLWLGVVPPEPTCSSCGATAVPPDLPVIPMQPRGRPTTWISVGTDSAAGSTITLNQRAGTAGFHGRSWLK